MGGGGSSCPYISDCLEFWLDGIDKGNNDGYWTDLIQGIKYTLNESQDVGIDYVRVPPFMDTDTFFGGYKTIECCFSEYAKWGAFMYGNKGNNNQKELIVLTTSNNDEVAIRLGRATTGTKFTFESGEGPDYTVNNKGTISGNDNLVMFAGNTTTSSSRIDLAAVPTSKYRIGGRPGFSTSDAFSKTACKIHSIRFYSKLLTEQEMLHNQRVDNTRFNLGLSI